MDYEYNKLKAQLIILRDLQTEYPTSTIRNAIQQIESRMKFLEQNKY